MFVATLDQLDKYIKSNDCSIKQNNRNVATIKCPDFIDPLVYKFLSMYIYILSYKCVRHEVWEMYAHTHTIARVTMHTCMVCILISVYMHDYVLHKVFNITTIW